MIQVKNNPVSIPALSKVIFTQISEHCFAKQQRQHEAGGCRCGHVWGCEETESPRKFHRQSWQLAASAVTPTEAAAKTGREMIQKLVLFLKILFFNRETFWALFNS